MSSADEWAFPVSGTEEALQFADIGDGVRVYDARHLWSDAYPQSSPVEKIGYTVHHAVTRLPDGTIADDLALIGAIWNHHVNTNGWGGIGYHRVIGNGRRVYIVGASSSQRAHVANLNHQWIGWCLLGDHTLARPNEEQMTALRRGTQWETDMRGVPMLLAPHKRLNPGTECPGGWAATNAWEGLVLHPNVQPFPDPPPGPTGDQIAREHIADAMRSLEAADTALR